jgi:hypothetical protein
MAKKKTDELAPYRAAAKAARPRKHTVSDEDAAAIEATINTPTTPVRTRESLEREAVANEYAAEKAEREDRFAEAQQHWENATTCWEAAASAEGDSK